MMLASAVPLPQHFHTLNTGWPSCVPSHLCPRERCRHGAGAAGLAANRVSTLAGRCLNDWGEQTASLAGSSICLLRPESPPILPVVSLG